MKKSKGIYKAGGGGGGPRHVHRALVNISVFVGGRRNVFKTLSLTKALYLFLFQAHITYIEQLKFK